MPLFISHTSALRFYRLWPGLPKQESSRLSEAKPRQNQKPDRAKLACALEFCGLDHNSALHITVAEPNCRKRSKHLVSHVDRGTITPGSFCALADSVYISSPEKCFVQMAQTLDLVELIALGFELSGSYYFNPAMIMRDPSHNLPQRPEPLTSPQKMLRFISKQSKTPGIKKARRAIQYVIEDTASPMETYVAMMLTLPFELGGYSLPKPEINHRIDIDKRVSHQAFTNYRKCDFYWPVQKVDLEYNSRQNHEGEEEDVRSSVRTVELSYGRIRVLPMRTWQFKQFRLLDAEAKTLAKLLGRTHESKLPDIEWRRRVLHAKLWRMRQQPRL